MKCRIEKLAHKKLIIIGDDIFMKLERYYENTDILHLGTEETRAYYIPCDLNGNERRRFLNGIWKFAYFNNITEAEEALEESIDYSSMNDLPVPSSWQHYGYDTPQYTNLNYPFPFDPPYVPADNPCGLYIRKIELDERDLTRRLFLVFEGVDSCFYLWMNEHFVGYSQVSHSTSEFDVTGFASRGENTIKVLVLKWCDGSYLEDQDKFRLSGIFRDVYLLDRPHEYIRDYTIRQEFEDEFRKARLHIETETVGNPEVQCILMTSDGKLIGRTELTSAKTGCICIDEPILWNAEQPYLYELELVTGEEIIKQKIGFRKIEVKDGAVLINGTKVKFKGVNRHDSDPYTGAAISKEQALIDLKLMKEHNINAIRTSHYPNSPWFLEMCDEYGFYVIGESDIESHGCSRIVIDGVSQFDLIARDPRFEQAILDRVQRNVIRDKNRTCVVIWSLGNESGYGINFIKAGRWVKQYDPSRLLQYESNTWQKGITEDISFLDVVSRMYAPVEWVKEYCEDKNNKKPFLHCEFCHAMGNGPGDLEENVQQIYEYDNYCGGFVWEWCDHAIYAGEAQNGRKKFLYGGDFGEFPHDGNFCIDGLVYPDRRVHTGLLEYKNVIRPVRLVDWDIEKGLFTFANKLDFSNLKDRVLIRYELKRDGNPIMDGMIEDIDISPHETGSVRLNIPKQTGGNVYLKFEYIQKNDDLLTKAGHLLGFDQICISKEPVIYKRPADTLAPLQIKENRREYTIIGENFVYVFSKAKGSFTSMNFAGDEILYAPVEYNIFRAPIDNDRNIIINWQEAGYDRAQARVYETEALHEGKEVVINCKMSIVSVSVAKILEFDMKWTIFGDGSIKAIMHGTRNSNAPYLPRLGLKILLPKTYQKVEYFGYGPFESYCDKHRASYIDRFETAVDKLHEDYIKPQENGSHYGCSYVKIYDNKRKLTVFGREPFSFNASNYTIEELANKKHNFELEEADYVTLCIDYMQSGVGSNSCGPELMEKYRLKQTEIHWDIDLVIS